MTPTDRRVIVTEESDFRGFLSSNTENAFLLRPETYRSVRIGDGYGKRDQVSVGDEPGLSSSSSPSLFGGGDGGLNCRTWGRFLRRWLLLGWLLAFSNKCECQQRKQKGG